jgi:hypothetical protein
MLETQLLSYLIGFVHSRLRQARQRRDFGDVAEKIVIVGVFVALAVAVGLLVMHAVTGDATRIAKQIAGAK